MMGRLKIILSGDFVLFVFDNFAEKFNQRIALGANQMVVMLVIVIMLIPCPAIAQPLFARKPAFMKQLQCPVHGREANGRILYLDQVVQILGAQVAFRLEKYFQNQFPLAGFLETCALEMLKKYFSFFFEMVHTKFPVHAGL